MPTTPFKNILYRMALLLRAPKLEKQPDLRVSGNRLYTRSAYIRLLRRHHVLGSAALIKDQERRVLLFCDSHHPTHIVNEHKMFRVASITKMAAALAALRAVEESRLRLDAPVLTYFPEVSSLPALQDVTLRQLLSHTAGLLDPPDLEPALIQGKPFPEIMGQARIAAPGQEFHYSNLGFGLVGSLLEAVYQAPVSLILKQLVFDPLEMRATLEASSLSREEIVPITRVLPYHPEKDLLVTPLGERPLDSSAPLLHYGYTAGAMYLDLPSLEKLMDCLARYGKPLLKSELGRTMTRPHASYGSASPTLTYGLGLLRIQDPSISHATILGHQGFAYGCADGAFWEEGTGRMILFLNGGASEARRGRLGLCNEDILKWALRKEMPQWSGSAK